MPLKASYPTLDEIPEAHREFYAERNGTWFLDAEGVEDTSGLKRALERERKTAADLAARYKGIDPEQYRAAVEKMQALEDKQLIDEGKVEELLKVRTERMRADYDARIAAATSDRETLSTRLSELLIDNTLKDAAIRHKVRDTAVTDALLRGRMVFKLVDGQAVPHRTDGSVWYGKDGSTPLSAEEWVGSILVQDAPHMFESSSGGGTPPGGGRSQVVNGTFAITEAQARDPHAYRAAKAAAEAAHAELVIQQ
jgi:hypothetical protein